MKEKEQRIREFAYQIWESEGCPQGQAERHWEMACSLIAKETKVGKPRVSGKTTGAATKKTGTSKAKPRQKPVSAVAKGQKTQRAGVNEEPAILQDLPKRAADNNRSSNVTVESGPNNSIKRF